MRPVLLLLEPYSYSQTHIRSKRSTFGPVATLTLESPAARRVIDVELSWVEGEGVVIVLISRLPRERENDDMSLDRFALRHIPELKDQDFNIDGSKPLRVEVARLMKLYADILAGEALPVVAGQSWEKGLIYQRV